MDMEYSDEVRDMPMHYAYFRKNDDCQLPDSEIETRIPNSVKEATTFEELYTSLCDMKVDLESNPAIESVDITMDVPDVPTGNDEEVMLDLDIKERRGLSTNLLINTSKKQKDYTVGIEGLIGNPTNHLDYIGSQLQYDLIHGNHSFKLGYSHPRGFFGNPFSLVYNKSYRNYLLESGVSCYSDSIDAEISNSAKSLYASFSLGMRDLCPQGDVEEEKILRSHCSLSMLNECHPSIISGLTIGYHSQDDELIPTEGSKLNCSLTYNGLLGDIQSLRGEIRSAVNIPLIEDILEEPGLLLHLKGYTGMNMNLTNKKSHYMDRFFLDSSYVHGFGMKDFGPKSKPEEGGRKEGDILGGDVCCALSAALSLPVVVSMDYSYGLRARLFYEIGNVWNKNTELKNIWNSSHSCLGVGILIPLLSSSALEVNYLINQKRFEFSFTLA